MKPPRFESPLTSSPLARGECVGAENHLGREIRQDDGYLTKAQWRDLRYRRALDKKYHFFENGARDNSGDIWDVANVYGEEAKLDSWRVGCCLNGEDSFVDCEVVGIQAYHVPGVPKSDHSLGSPPYHETCLIVDRSPLYVNRNMEEAPRYQNTVIKIRTFYDEDIPAQAIAWHDSVPGYMQLMDSREEWGREIEKLRYRAVGGAVLAEAGVGQLRGGELVDWVTAA